jgi:hypothetical protein
LLDKTFERTSDTVVGTPKSTNKHVGSRQSIARTPVVGSRDCSTKAVAEFLGGLALVLLIAKHAPQTSSRVSRERFIATRPSVGRRVYNLFHCAAAIVAT